MSRLDVAQQFIQRTQKLQTEDELFRLLEEVTPEIGFRYFALINHVDLRHSQRNVIHFDNYPAPWAAHFIENGLYTQDPILQASLLSNVGFPWTSVPKMIEITSRQKSILERAAKNGLGDGYTVPANIPGERCGSCSFATRRGLVAPAANFHLAQLIGAFAFQAARRLNHSNAMPQRRQTPLTPRQRDCLLWAIKGKTDWEIGRILGLNQETVSRHLDMARERYGVTKRLPLAVHAIFDGQISFIEALF